MAKRFIDTGLFDDEWFSELSQECKIFWIYFITKCDHAGFLKYNKRLIEFQTGINFLDTVVKQFGNRILRVNEQLLFSPKFIQYQYPGFPNCKFKAALSAIELIKKQNIDLKSLVTVGKELPNSYGNGNSNGICNGNTSGEDYFLVPELPEMSGKEFSEFQAKLLDDKIFTQPLMMNRNIKSDDLVKWVMLFNTHIAGEGKINKDYSEYRKHFKNWILKQDTFNHPKSSEKSVEL